MSDSKADAGSSGGSGVTGAGAAGDGGDPALLFERAGLDEGRVQTIVGDALQGCDDGELFMEYSQSESLVLDDGRIKSANFDTNQGFGLRAVAGEQTGYAHASELNEAAIARAGEAVRAVRSGHGGSMSEAPLATNQSLYPDDNPLGEVSFADKVQLLGEVDSYARGRDPRVRQVTVSLHGEWQAVEIMRADGRRIRDVRPLVRLNVAVVLGEGERQESGSHGVGDRIGFSRYVETANWRAQVDEAMRQAEVNLSSVPAPAGEMQVVLGPGWPGILLHEAIGHGLEGDFNRKQTSAFAGLLGERVASPGVTVVDDGSIDGRRGSL
ncbi:MAG: metallopeptidase TldD-related protein, partial [Alphaproteobacteria bacterium]|nr:metallopeptidase TldD-related protein [Alphaproteobacteria bacterium]